MLKKAQRLTRLEFSHFFKVGKRINDPLFTIIYAPNTTFKGAVVVSKKLYKSAPSRNRLRRQAYALLAEKTQNNNAMSLIIIFNPKAKDLSRPQLLSRLEVKLDEL